MAEELGRGVAISPFDSYAATGLPRASAYPSIKRGIDVVMFTDMFRTAAGYLGAADPAE